MAKNKVTKGTVTLANTAPVDVPELVADAGTIPGIEAVEDAHRAEVAEKNERKEVDALNEELAKMKQAANDVMAENETLRQKAAHLEGMLEGVKLANGIKDKVAEEGTYAGSIDRLGTIDELGKI